MMQRHMGSGVDGAVLQAGVCGDLGAEEAFAPDAADVKKTGGLRGGGPPLKRGVRGLLNRSVEAGFVEGFLEGGG
jgi:hypothetical protein